MIDDIRRSILDNSLISKGDNVIVSLSGGPDSVALLLVLNSLRTEFDMGLSAFHLNHLIRGAEAAGDERFCGDLCKKHDIKLYNMTEDIPAYAQKNRISVEMAGRERRYALLDELCEAYDIDKAATGHTLDDNVETVLLNIMRGTGLNGLCGIRAKRGRIIRPLLDIRKSRLIDYLKELGQDYVSDSTNQETDYTRNYIRNSVIPDIYLKTGKDLSVSVPRMIKNLRADEQFIEAAAVGAFDRLVTKSGDRFCVGTKQIKNESRAVASRIILRIVRELGGSGADIEETHIESVLELAQKQSGSRLDLPRGLGAKIEFDALCLSRHENEASGPVPQPVKLAVPGRTVFGGYEFFVNIITTSDIVNNKLKKDTSVIYLDYDKISCMDIIIRQRMPGDFFSPKGRDITKKLKKYLIEAKIPADERDKLPVLAVQNEIIWIPGIDFTGGYEPVHTRNKILVCKYKTDEVEYD